MIDAYALTLAAFLLTAGSVADGFGRRRVFVLGLVVFTVASPLCGLAGSPLVLNLARGLQGVGGAMMFATSLALLASAYEGRDRGTAIGIWGATIGAAVAVGPLVGGVLVEAIGWEAIFFVNLPIGVAAVALTQARVARVAQPAGRRRRLGRHRHLLGRPVPDGLRAHPRQRRGLGRADHRVPRRRAAALLVAFVVVERRIAQPMFDLSLFRNPSFCGASIAAFVLLGIDVRDVPLPHALRAEHPRLLGARVRPALPADHGRLVRRRAVRRQARRARGRPRCSWPPGSRSSAPGCCSWADWSRATTGPRCSQASWWPAAASA